LLALPNPKIGYNSWLFDALVAEHNGIVWNGEHDDVMWCIHHLWPDIPGNRNKDVDATMEGSLMNLQYAASMNGYHDPWKHLVASQPEWYGCHDSNATLHTFNRVKADMQKLRYGSTGPTVWDSYCKMVYNIMPILDSMRRRGVPINKPKMLEFLKSVVNRQRAKALEIQAYIPSEIRSVSPKLGYAKRPKEDSGNLVQRQFEIPEVLNKRCKCNRIRKKNLDTWMQNPKAEWDNDDRLRCPDSNCELCGGEGYVNQPAVIETRWCKLLPFNPSSSPQLQAYAAFNRHNIPMNSKKKRTLDKENREKMYRKTGDRFYKDVTEFKEFDKMRVYALGWMPKGEDGCIHAIGSFFPATGQLSFTDPNVQTKPNASKYGQLATDFGSAIEAGNGYTLIEFDYKSYHAQTLGYEAQCWDYIRLAKIDIHSYLATAMLKIEHHEQALEWEDDELKAWLKWYRKNYHLKDGSNFELVRNKQAKPGILGYGFGLGAGKLYRLNEDSFNNQNEAQHVLDTLDATFPEVKAYRNNVPLIAYKQGGKIITRYGCIRWFFDLQRFDFERREYVRSGDWEKAIAFAPANVAFCHKKIAMTRLEEIGADARYGLILDIHDALLFRCPVSLVEEALSVVQPVMEAVSEYMPLAGMDREGFLGFEVEAKMGPNWADMKEV
jgi:DNA polymerase I-like protein with 3'-5' exonuclease and polymerase domains